MYVEYSRRHYNRRWEIIKRENYMDYYDPWDWNVPFEDTSPAYWNFRKTVNIALVKQKHVTNMLVLHKYRNAFRSWVPFYHSWIDPFDRRWATKSNKWPSFVNIRSSKVDQGLRPGHTNLTYIREFLIFEVKPLLYKANRIEFWPLLYKNSGGMKGLTRDLMEAHKIHGNFLIYKNFHKKRLKKKYEYISNLTAFDFKEMHSYYDRWFFHDWLNVMGWTSERLLLEDVKIFELSEQKYTFNRISSFLENLLLIFNFYNDKNYYLNFFKQSAKEFKMFNDTHNNILDLFNNSLKKIVRVINLETSFKKTLFYNKKRRNKHKNYLKLNTNTKHLFKKNINMEVMKKMFNISFDRNNFLSLLNNINKLINLLNYLQSFFYHLASRFAFALKRSKGRLKWEATKKKLGFMPYYEHKRRRIRRHFQIFSSGKFAFHKLNYSRRVRIKRYITGLLRTTVVFKDLLYLLRLVSGKNRLNFLKLTHKRTVLIRKPITKQKSKKKKTIAIVKKSDFFLREKRFDVKDMSWRDPMFRLTGAFSLESGNSLSSRPSKHITLEFFNKLMQLENVKSLKRFVIKSRKILTYYRHMGLKIPTQAKKWNDLLAELKLSGHTYYPYYLRIYSWMHLPTEIPEYMRTKKKPFLLLTGPLMTSHKSLILSMRFKRKNLYFTLTDFLGRVLVSVSAASQGIKKGRYFSAHLLRPMYRKLVRCFRKNRVSSYFYRARSKHKGLFKYLRVFLQNRGILLRGLVDQIKRPHNGMRRKKTRRL